MKNKINNAMISNKRVYISIAIVLLAIFIIGIIALGVFKIGRGGDTPTPTYYSYKIDNSNLPENPSLEPDGKTFIINTNIKYHEVMTFTASSDASVGVYSQPNSYLYAGTSVSFTLTLNEESYYLSEVEMSYIKVSNNGDEPTYTLPENQYTKEYNGETKSYKVTISNSEVRYIHSISLRYSVIKK